MDHLVAVSEHLGDDGSGHFTDQFSQGSVAGAEKVEAKVAKAIHDGVGVQVFARPDAGK